MINVQGLIVIDVDVVSLNNAGGGDKSVTDNDTVVKKIFKNGKAYPYVSGQAWRNWWRMTLENSFNMNPSPITRDSKIAFTEANPIIYMDDDVFGYMRAPKKDKTAKDGDGQAVTLTRVSPLRNSVLISTGYNKIPQHFSVMGRGEGNPVPYAKEEYSAIMKGMFSLAIDQIGTFSTSNRTGFKNLDASLQKIAIDNKAVEIDDPYNSQRKTKMYRLPVNLRKDRVRDTLYALKVISGGAKLTTNFTDVTPKIIILAKLKSANNPFSHIMKEELNNAVFSIDALKQVIDDYANYFEGKVYIGKREGFMDDLKPALENMNGKEIIFGSVNQIIDDFTKSVIDSME